MNPALAKIDHVVVLLMENRSFDHYLGYLRLHGGRTDIDGPTGHESNPWQGQDYRLTRAGTRNVHADPPHGHERTLQQLRDGNRGFVAAYMEAEGQHPDARPDDVMLYYDERMLPVYDFFAREYCVCDHWHASLPGPTWPNRMYALAGTADGRLTNDIPPAPGLTFPSIFDVLTARGVDWRFYEHDVGSIRLFASHLGDDTHVLDYHDPNDGFLPTARGGRLPAVTFIDPDFTQIPSVGTNDDHPPSHPLYGQDLAGRIYEALRQGPQWNRTALIITYDEHGGFYDHVVPPAAEDDHYPRYGVRVPTFIVSPWVGRGVVRSETYDHTSTLKTILARFVPDAPRLSRRVDHARDLSLAFSEPHRRHTPPAPAVDLAMVKDVPTGGPTDLAAGLAELRARRNAVRAARAAGRV